MNPARGQVLMRLHHGSLQMPDGRWSTDFRWAMFSPDGDRFLTGGADVARVWETTTGKPLYSPLKHEGACGCAAFSPDGRFIVTGSEEGKARVWDVATGQLAAEPLPHPGTVTSACFSPDGGHVLTSCYDGMAQLWNWRTGRLVCPPFKAVTYQCWSGCFTADGRWVLTAGGSESTPKRCRVWESRTGKPVTPPLLHDDTRDPRIVVTPDGRHAISFGRRASIRVFHLGDLYEPGDFSSDDLCLLAELLSGHRIHESDVARLTTEEWLDRWRLFRERHTHYFQLEPGDRLAWHRQQVEEAEAAGQWSAVIWHLDRLTAAEPQDAPIRLRRAHALEQLGEREKALADLSKAIELDPENAEARNERIAAYLTLEQWDKAAADFAKAIELKADQPHVWYQHALVRLAANDCAGYRKACAGMLERFGQSPDLDAGHWTTWTCLLAPDAVADWGRLLQLAQKVVAADPKNFDKLEHLGAVLYRAGRLGEAAKRLTEAEAAFKASNNPRGSIIYNWLFQAMTEHRLSHAEEAKRLLGKAVKDIEQPPPDRPQDGTAIAWNRRLTLQLLRREAEALLGTQVQPLPKPELLPMPKEVEKDSPQRSQRKN